jgi:hypothetical protein
MCGMLGYGSRHDVTRRIAMPLRGGSHRRREKANSMIYIDGKKAITSTIIKGYVVAVVNSRLHTGFDALIIPADWGIADMYKSHDTIASMNGYANFLDAFNAGKREALKIAKGKL